MNRILAIAQNTFRETVRDKILYNLILFALVMIASSLALGQLTLGNEDKVILDLGLGAISIFGLLIAIFIGIGLVYKELEKRTVYALLAKPVRRHELILGKYLGLLLTLAVNVAVMTVGLALALAYTGRAPAGAYLRLLPAVGLIFLALALATALALLFSTFSTPALSALFTFFIWVIGHFNADLARVGKGSAVGEALGRTLYYVIPNFSNFNLIDGRAVLQTAGYARPIEGWAVAGAGAYAVIYIALLLAIAIVIFSRRDFK
ncbi:MAG: ABC transporter permease [Acidobacteriota bacterium]|jgi:ABC-type transport system involved in multi-copper enzyme maturation permease subunit|nr:ABC transporter permease [Acidobacteriota bacterium]NLT33269.1 ABC transporter permease [Acidobacteriota bacterium]